MEERFFIVGIKVWKKSSFQPTEKVVPKFYLSPKPNFEKLYCTIQTLQRKSPNAIKNFGRFLFNWVLFWDKNRLFLTRLCAFHIVIHPHIFPIYNDIRFIGERTLHSHIQRFFCFHKLSFSFLRITVIPVHFYYFIFCLEFYFPIVV